MKDEKSQKKSFWIDQHGKFKRHEFQIVIDALAFSKNLPLQVIDCEELNNISASKLWYLSTNYEDRDLDFNDPILNQKAEQKLKYFCENIKNLFNSPEKFKEQQDFPPALKYLSKTNQVDGIKPNYLFEISQNMWKNFHSNPLPLHILFRLTEEWRWFTIVWFYIEIREKINSDKINENGFKINAFYIDEIEYHFRWLNFGQDKKYLLAIGQIYKHPTIREAGVFDEHSNKIIAAFRRFYNYYCKNSLTHISEKETMHRLAHMRLYMSMNELNLRIGKIVSILQSMSVTLFDINTSLTEYHDYYAITNIYITVHSLATSFWWIQSVRKKKSSFLLDLIFQLPHRNNKDHIKLTIKIISEKEIIIETFLFGYDIEKSDLRIIKKLKYKKFFLIYISSTENEIETFLARKESNHEKTRIHEKIIEINRASENLDEEINNRLRSWQVLRSNMFNSWLQKHYAGLTQQANSVFDERIYRYICFAILEEFRSDSAILCKAFYSDKGRIKVLASTYNIQELGDKHEELIDSIEKPDPETKSMHPIYQAINKGEIIQFTSDYKCTQGDSYIVVPIKFQGRVYGALKISGCKEHQFEWLHQYILHNISNILANYFHNQQLIFSLQHITEKVLQHPASYHTNFDQTIKLGKTVYQEILNGLSDIFLANDVRLRLRDPFNYKRYLLAGHHSDTIEYYDILDRNFPKISYELFTLYSKEDESERFITIKINTDKDKSEFSKEDKCFTIGNDYFEEKNDQHGLRETLKSYESGIAFVITKGNKDDSDNGILGYVCLFYKNKGSEDYIQNWRNIIELVNKQLVIAFEALETFGSYRDTESALLLHEIKQDAWVLSETAKKIAITLKHFKSQLLDRSTYTILKKKLPHLIDVRGRLDWKIALREEGKKISLKKLFGNPDCVDFNDPDEFIDLWEAVNDIFQNKTSAFNNKGIFVRILILKNSKLFINRHMLYNMLQNLIGNALKYSLSGTEVYIKLNKSNPRLFSISNIGIALTDEDKNFKPFDFGSRSNHAKKHDQGDGMGLYIVSRICELYNIEPHFQNKTIENDSQKQEYIFSFTIPSSLFREISR